MFYGAFWNKSRSRFFIVTKPCDDKEEADKELIKKTEFFTKQMPYLYGVPKYGKGVVEFPEKIVIRKGRYGAVVGA